MAAVEELTTLESAPAAAGAQSSGDTPEQQQDQALQGGPLEAAAVVEERRTTSAKSSKAAKKGAKVRARCSEEHLARPCSERRRRGPAALRALRAPRRIFKFGPPALPPCTQDELGELASQITGTMDELERTMGAPGASNAEKETSKQRKKQLR